MLLFNCKFSNENMTPMYVILYFLALICGHKTEISKLIQKAASVANIAYRHPCTTTVVWWRNETDDINEFLNSYQGSVITISIDNGNINNILPTLNINQTIMFANALGEFKTFIEAVNHYSKTPIYLILVWKNVVQGYELSKIAEIAWKNSLADIITITANDNEAITLSTYFPYTDESCKDYTPTAVVDDNIFPNKFKNFHLCPIKASLLHFVPYLDLKRNTSGKIVSISGIDGNFFMLIVKAINSTVDIVASTDRGGFGTVNNGNATGSFRDLLNRTADILIPAGIITRNRYAMSQITHAYYIFDIYWCGPKQRKIYPWAKVLLPLYTDITPFLLLSFVAFILTTMLAKKLKVSHNTSSDSVLFQSFVIFLGQAINFLTTSPLVNSLFVLWIWFCFIVRIVYQGDLINGLEKDFLEARFGTLEDAFDKVDGVGGAEVILEYYKNTFLETKYEVLSLVDIPKHLRAISEGERYLLATDMIIIRPLRAVLQILDEPISRATTCLYMRPGWPAARQVDFVMLRLIETGFLEYIINNHNRQFKGSHNGGKETQSLDMSTLSACFYGLILMWLICGVIFFIEIVYYKYKQNKFIVPK